MSTVGLMFGILALVFAVAGFCLWLRTDRERSPARHIAAIVFALGCIALNLWLRQ